MPPAGEIQTIDDLGDVRGRTVYMLDFAFGPELTAALDERVAAALAESGVAVRIGEGQLLYDPDTVRNQSGGPFKVFTPFRRHCANLERPQPADTAVPTAP